MIEHPVVEEIREILKDTYTERGVTMWLTSRNRNLWAETPEDLIKEGLSDEVLREARRVARS